MVDTYGRWVYETNIPKEKKCLMDEVADWIISTGYEVKTSIENITTMVVSWAEQWYYDEQDDTEFDLEYIKDYIEGSCGLSEYDFYC